MSIERLSTLVAAGQPIDVNRDELTEQTVRAIRYDPGAAFVSR